MKAITSIFVFLLLPACLLLNSCKRENMFDAVKGTGKRVTETRNISGFTKIHMEDKIDVYFTQSIDSSYEVKVEGGSHLIPLIKTEVVDGELRIKNDNKFDWMRSYKKSEIKVFVKAPHLISLTSDAVGNFYCNDTLHEDRIDYSLGNSGDVYLKVDCNILNGHFHGAGDAYLSGNVHNENDFYSVGQSFINAENLNTNYTWIYYNSSGEAHIRVFGLLFAILPGSGNVYYTGTPSSIERRITGSGKLINY